MSLLLQLQRAAQHSCLAWQLLLHCAVMHEVLHWGVSRLLSSASSFVVLLVWRGLVQVEGIVIDDLPREGAGAHC